MCAHFLGDRQSCCVVCCTVDSEAGAEFLDIFADLKIVDPVLSVAVDSRDVVVDSHDLIPFFCPGVSLLLGVVVFFVLFHNPAGACVPFKG